MQDNTADEFDVMMDLLGNTHLAKSVAGQKELIEIVAEQVELSQPYNPADEEQVDKLLHGLKRALPFFSVSTNYQIANINKATVISSSKNCSSFISKTQYYNQVNII